MTFYLLHILNRDANTTSEFNPVSAANWHFSSSLFCQFPPQPFRFTSCFSFCCQPVTLICWQLCLCWTHWVLVPFWPFLFQWHHPRNTEAARGVASRSSLYFTLFVSTLLRFNLNNLIYIMIISASCLLKFVQDIKLAHPAAIKTNVELIPSYCSNIIHLPSKEVWYWGKRVLIMCNVNGCWWMTDLFGTNN